MAQGRAIRLTKKEWTQIQDNIRDKRHPRKAVKDEMDAILLDYMPQSIGTDKYEKVKKFLEKHGFLSEYKREHVKLRGFFPEHTERWVRLKIQWAMDQVSQEESLPAIMPPDRLP